MIDRIRIVPVADDYLVILPDGRHERFTGVDAAVKAAHFVLAVAGPPAPRPAAAAPLIA